MSTKYFTNMSIALLAGFVVVVSFAFAPVDGAWIAFGVAVGILSLAVLAQVARKRGSLQRLLDVGIALAAITMIVTSLVYAGPVVAWVFFGVALGLLGLSVTGLTLHEIDRWRAEHGMAELRGLHRLTVARRTEEESRLAA